MSLINRSMRPPDVLSDEAVARYLIAIRREIDPDPLFRRRLRGHVVNRFVSAREEHRLPRRSVRREMGRVGRAVLYASFALGIGVTGVMAASRHAIPSDVFYPVKLYIEEVRAQALPAHLQDELAAYNLGQRIEELRRLADAGEWRLVTAHAAAVERAYEAMVAASGGETPIRAANLAIITGLIEQLPEEAREALEAVMSAMPGVGQQAAPGQTGSGPGGGPPGGNSRDGGDSGSSRNGSPDVGGPNGGGPRGTDPAPASTSSGGNARGPAMDGSSGASDGTDAIGAEPQPTASSEPAASPQPTASPRPTKSPKPTKSPQPSESSLDDES